MTWLTMNPPLRTRGILFIMSEFTWRWISLPAKEYKLILTMSNWKEFKVDNVVLIGVERGEKCNVETDFDLGEFLVDTNYKHV